MGNQSSMFSMILCGLNRLVLFFEHKGTEVVMEILSLQPKNPAKEVIHF